MPKRSNILSYLRERASLITTIVAAALAIGTSFTYLFGTPPFANEERVALLEGRLNLQDRITTRKEIIRLEDEKEKSKNKKLSPRDEEYLQELRERLQELKEKKK